MLLNMKLHSHNLYKQAHDDFPTVLSALSHPVVTLICHYTVPPEEAGSDHV